MKQRKQAAKARAIDPRSLAQASGGSGSQPQPWSTSGVFINTPQPWFHALDPDPQPW